MLEELKEKVPSARELLLFTEDQLDEILLGVIARRVNAEGPLASKNVSHNEIQNLYPVGLRQSFEDSQGASSALLASWGRLQTAGYTVQANGQADHMITLTPRGKALAGIGNFAELAMRQKLTRDMLHPEFQGAVYKNFAAGDYDTAVRDAMVAVEDAMRKAAGLTNADFGVPLIRKAFKPVTGILIDKSLSTKDQQSVLDLFLSTFATIRNPGAHRKVGKKILSRSSRN
jgi:uncharacterized protein (TIGR02391 family)